MAQPIQAFSITAPGFYGLNTQDSSLDLAQGFALIANNCVIDQYGRIGARKVGQRLILQRILTCLPMILLLLVRW